MTVRVGVIGVGVMGADHVRNLHHAVSGAQVSAICDFNRDTAHAVAHTVPEAGVFDDGVSLIRSDAVDAVVIASHDSTHAELVLAALDAGKPYCARNRWRPPPPKHARSSKPNAVAHAP